MTIILFLGVFAAGVYGMYLYFEASSRAEHARQSLAAVRERAHKLAEWKVLEIQLHDQQKVVSDAIAARLGELGIGDRDTFAFESLEQARAQGQAFARVFHREDRYRFSKTLWWEVGRYNHEGLYWINRNDHLYRSRSIKPTYADPPRGWIEKPFKGALGLQEAIVHCDNPEGPQKDVAVARLIARQFSPGERASIFVIYRSITKGRALIDFHKALDHLTDRSSTYAKSSFAFSGDLFYGDLMGAAAAIGCSLNGAISIHEDGAKLL